MYKDYIVSDSKLFLSSIHHPYKWNNHIIIDIMMFEVDFVPDNEEDLLPPNIH